MHIEVGNDGWYSTITFKRESSSHLHLKVVTYVLGMKKNLISIALLEDYGFDVIFSKGKAFLRHLATRKVKKIGVRVKNLYKHEEGDCAALSNKGEKVQRRDVGGL